ILDRDRRLARRTTERDADDERGTRRNPSHGRLSLATETLPQEVRRDRRIRATLRLLHHLTDEEAEQAIFAGSVRFGLLRVRLDHPIDDLVERSFVADLLYAAALDDRLRRVAGLVRLLEDLFTDLAADRAVLDEAKKLGQTLRRHRRVFDRLA